MAKFHINGKGEPGQCRAEKSCPFGGEDAHFTSAEAARASYEKQQSGVFAGVKTPQQKFPFLVKDLGAEKPVVDGKGKFADGSYPKLNVAIEPDGFKIYGARRELLAYIEDNTNGGKPEDSLSVNPEYLSVPSTPLGTVKSAAPKKSVRAPKPISFPAPNTAAEFDKAILATVPEVENAKVGGPPQANDDQGYMGGRRFIGALAGQKDADGKSIFIGQTAAAAGIRKLVGEAKAAGELPKWIDVSVKKNDGAWVSSISVNIGYKPGGATKAEAIPTEWVSDGENSFRRNQREAANRLEAYVSHLAKQYESSDINGQVDYFNSSNAGRVSWKDKWN